MSPFHLSDLLAILIPTALFLNAAAYRLTASHRPITPFEWSVVIAFDLALLALGALLVRRASKRRSLQALLPNGDRIRARWHLWIPVAAHAVAKIPYLDIVPRWDAGVYFADVVRATETLQLSAPKLAANFRLAGHPSQAYGLYLGIGQLLFPYSHWVMNFQNLLLALAGVYFFGLIVRRLMPEWTALQQGLATLAFAFHPLYFGAGIHINTDFPATVAFLFVLMSILYNRAILFGVASCCLVFSKEPGAFAYGLTLMFVFLFYVLPRARSAMHLVVDLEGLLHFPQRATFPAGRSLRGLFASLGIWAMAASPVLLFLYQRSFVPRDVWGSTATNWSDTGLLCFGLNSRNFQAVLGQALVMNFSWLPTLAMLAYLAKSQIWRTPNLIQDGGGRRTVVRVLGFVFVLYLLLHCLYINYANARYVLLLAPLSLLLGGYCLHQLVSDRRVLNGLVGIFLALSVVQTWSAVDPVGNRIWYTYEIGSRTMLGPGASDPADQQSKADGMVYNAQFVAIERLYREVNRWALARSPRPPIVFGMNHAWLMYYGMGLLRIDPTTLDYTMKQEGTLRPLGLAIDAIDPAAPPATAVYVAMPWVESVTNSLARLGTMYTVAEVRRLSYGDYYVDAYALERRPH